MVCCVAVMALWGLLLGGVRAVTGLLGLGVPRDRTPGFPPPGRHEGPGCSRTDVVGRAA